MNSVVQRKKTTFGSAANSKWSLSAVGVLFKTDLCAIWKRYQAIPLWCFFLFYSNLIKWNWELCKCAWMARTAGRARTSETHASIIGNVLLFRDFGFIVGFPHSQIWNMGSFYMSSLRFLSSFTSWKWQQLPLKYRTFQRDQSPTSMMESLSSMQWLMIFFLSFGSTSPKLGAFLCKSHVLLRDGRPASCPPSGWLKSCLQV